MSAAKDAKEDRCAARGLYPSHESRGLALVSVEIWKVPTAPGVGRRFRMGASYSFSKLVRATRKGCSTNRCDSALAGQRALGGIFYRGSFSSARRVIILVGIEVWIVDGQV